MTSTGNDNLLDSFLERSDFFIDHLHGRGDLRAVRTMFVALMIDFRKIEGNQMWAAFFRQAQPIEHLFDALIVGQFIVIFQIVRRARALNLRFRTGPEETGGAHALLFGQHPKRSAAVPRAIRNGCGIAKAISLFALRIVKTVGHNSVVFGIQPGGQRVVIGKSQAGVRGNHAIRRGCAHCSQR